MPYSAEISRTNPSCFLFLIDQSGSMADRSARRASRKKADAVADAINRLLQNLVIKCAKAEGSRLLPCRRHRLRRHGRPGPGRRAGGQGPGADQRVGNAAAARRAARPRRSMTAPAGWSSSRSSFPVWFEPMAHGGTPMCQALTLAHDHARRAGWRSTPTASRPSSSTSPTARRPTATRAGAAPTLRDLASSDGNVLLFNSTCRRRRRAADRVSATTRTACRTSYARQLFELSSPLPPTHAHDRASRRATQVGESERAALSSTPTWSR